MSTLDIIKCKLKFLIDKYDFDFEFINVSGNHYFFKNRNGYIEFYEWPQFDESAIFVNYNMISKEIKLIEEYPKIMGKFIQSHKGFLGFFKDERYDYWEMISNIIQIEINTNNNIFGLKL